MLIKHLFISLLNSFPFVAILQHVE